MTTLPPATYIQRDSDLRRLVNALKSEPLVAIDTESNSLYAYRERVCLVQISTRSADYIVDPLTVHDMTPFAEVMSDPAIEKVFHAAEYDLICLKRDYQLTCHNLFDTMIAARIVGLKLVGLGNLLEKYAGVKADKSHQRDNWGQRPLPKESLLYAQMDTHYLPLLRDNLQAELVNTNRLAEAHETFEELCRVPPGSNEFDPEGYWSIGYPYRLPRRQMAILRELYLFRDQIARQRNVPLFKVFTDKTLVAIAQNAPHEVNDLHGIDGMSPTQLRRYGASLIQAVGRGETAKLPQPPARQPAVDPDVVERYTALRDWRRGRAQERGVESDVIISKDALWALAEKSPKTLEEMADIPGLGPWRLNAYGQEILDMIQRFENGR
jgi:ribonuclease D